MDGDNPEQQQNNNMSQGKPPRSAEQILADKQKARNKGGRPPGRKNNATLEREAAEAAARQASGNDKTPEQQKTDLDLQLEKLKAEYKEPAQQQPPPQQAPPQAAPGQQSGQQAAPQAQPAEAGAFTITGHLGLVVLDSLVPGAVAFVLNTFFGWGGTVSKEQLQLTERETRELEPLADEIVKRINADPLLLFVIAYGGCIVSKIPPRPEQKKDSDEVARLLKIIDKLEKEANNKATNERQAPRPTA